jgi:ACS family hexuronate transporter-like MFS transporter
MEGIDSSSVRMAAIEPGKVRAWLPAVAMMLVNVLSYIDRNTLALLAPTILRDAGLTNQQYGFIISAFSITYMVCNPLWGRIVDRHRDILQSQL